MVCCGRPMTRLEGNTTDASMEKHVPMVEKVAGGYKITVGSTPHPMSAEHYIQWIELLTPTEVLRKELQPTDRPEATFVTDSECVGVREYCNLHGLWKA